MNQALILSRHLVQQIFHHAQSAPESEVCGIVSEAENGELIARKISNRAADPSKLFSMDEAELVAAMQAMRDNQQELFAIYHSHPTAAAVPSARDLEDIGYPDAWQLIISLNTKGVLELRAWKLVNGEACETLLRIIEV